MPELADSEPGAPPERTQRLRVSTEEAIDSGRGSTNMQLQIGGFHSFLQSFGFRPGRRGRRADPTRKGEGGELQKNDRDDAHHRYRVNSNSRRHDAYQGRLVQ